MDYNKYPQGIDDWLEVMQLPEFPNPFDGIDFWDWLDIKDNDEENED
jgi:hypothetical protein